MKKFLAAGLAALALGGIGTVISSAPASADGPAPIYTNVGTPNGDIYVSRDGGQTWQRWAPSQVYTVAQ